MFLIVSLKGSIDPDYYNYMSIYNIVMDSSESFPFSSNENLKFEKGFLFFLALLKEFGLSFNYIYGIYAIISTVFVLFIIRSFEKINANIAFLFLYAVSFVGIWVQIRFGLASLGLLLSVIYFIKSKYVKSFFVYLFSLLTHNIVLAVLIPVFFYIILNRFRFSKLFIFFVFLIISPLVFFDFAVFFENLLVFFNDRYAGYINESAGSISSYFIRMVLFLTMLFLIRKDLFQMSVLSRVLLSMAFSSVLIFLIASKITIFYRLGVVFELGYLMFFMRENYSSKDKYIVSLFIMFVFILYRFLDVPTIVEPYKTFWVE